MLPSGVSCFDFFKPKNCSVRKLWLFYNIDSYLIDWLTFKRNYRSIIGLLINDTVIIQQREVITQQKLCTYMDYGVVSEVPRTKLQHKGRLFFFLKRMGLITWSYCTTYFPSQLIGCLKGCRSCKCKFETSDWSDPRVPWASYINCEDRGRAGGILSQPALLQTGALQRSEIHTLCERIFSGWDHNIADEDCF